ncbi:MAG: DUF3466 family protein, partial [Planctomycetota bacterium]
MRRPHIAITLLACLLAPSVASAGILYEVIDLGGGYSSVPRGISSDGRTAGHHGASSSVHPQAVTWTQEGTRSYLPTVGGNYDAAFDVSDTGLIVGRSTTDADPLNDTNMVAAVWELVAGFYTARELPALGDLPYASAMGVSDAGIVVGYAHAETHSAYWYEGYPTSATTAVVWSGADQSVVTSLAIPGEQQSAAFAVNEHGAIAGEMTDSFGQVQAMLWTPDGAGYTPTPIGMLPGGNRSYGRDVNDQGVVVGRSQNQAGQEQAFVWQDGQIEGLPLLPGQTSSRASGVNNLGQIVGSADLNVAMLWDNDQAIDLNTVIEPLTGGHNEGMVLSEARAINDQGMIAVSGRTPAPFAATRAYLLVPIPQWKIKTGGSYHPPENWTDGSVPNDTGAVARFLQGITGPEPVAVDSQATLGTIIFDNVDDDNGYTISGAAQIILQAVAEAQINVLKGDHTISAPLLLASDTDVTVGSGHSLFLSGDVSDVGGSKGLAKMGTGLLELGGNNSYLGETKIVEGTLAVSSNDNLGDPSSVLRFDGGTLRTTGLFSGVRSAVIDPGGATIDTMDTTSLTLNSPGSTFVFGDVTKEGTGTCLLGEELLLMRKLNVNAGTLQLAGYVPAIGEGDVTIGDGATLKASGAIARHIVGGPGSTLEAIGMLEIGNLGDRYVFQGRLIVGPHAVYLKDTEPAELRGAHMAGGKLANFDDIHLLPVDPADIFNSGLFGDGVVNGNVVMGIEGHPIPALVVADPGGNINFTGVIQTGSSTFVNNVSISGTERLGFSPAVGMKLGAPIGPDVVLDIYGDVGADFESEIPDSILPP